jgi:multisubunit Na+/H+ antiporter MnhB subunit
MLDFFENLSPLTQLILVFVGLAFLFLIILANNRKNKNKLSQTKNRTFRERYKERRSKNL